ncbi:MAG: ribosomal protein S18-alanine N-acetyltransferase [Arenicella sp.]|nr:ribosomal protein S18-alanine N-acetyltransferase [Arenicella sp.]
MKPLTLDSLLYRPMLSTDLDQVVAIERSTQAVSWSRLSFEECLTNSYACHVLERNCEVLAFSINCSVIDELHILNLAVSKPWQGNGLGHVLMQNIVQWSEQHGSRKLFLEVRASNKIAQSLYFKWQFRQISVRRAYYRTGEKQREDALVLVRERGQPVLANANL